MLLIPAIDLKDGKCVRLRQGKMEDDTVFSDDPVMMAKNPQSGGGSANSISVQPVGDAALKSGKAVDPAGPADGAAAKKDSKEAKDKSADKPKDKSEDGTKTAAVPKKKSGPLHMFKRVLKPF